MFNKNVLAAVLVPIMALALINGHEAQGNTIATFFDPTSGSATPLFTIDLNNDRITAGWSDAQTNLTLEVILTGNVYSNAFFTMTEVIYTGGLFGGNTEGGTIKFFADGVNPDTAIPLIRIDFNSAYVSPNTFGALDLFRADGVIISGSEVQVPLVNESFAFSFANVVPTASGFTATAAFTSSADIVPEPTTLILLGLSSVALVRFRKRP